MAIELIEQDGMLRFSGRSVFPSRDKNALLRPRDKMLHLFGVVLELYPNEKQAEFFRRCCGCARVVHNDFISRNLDIYHNQHRKLSVSEYKKVFLPNLKKERPYLTEVDKFALEAGIENAETAFHNFFSGRAKYPKFASKSRPSGNRYTTKETNGNIAIGMYDGSPCVKLPKAGYVSFAMPKGCTFSNIVPIGARITKATISLKNDRWFVSLALETIIDLVHPIRSLARSEILAGDAGIKEFLIYGGETAENTVHVENPRWIRVHEKRLRRFQKQMSRRQYDCKTHKGSRNWQKAKKKVAKEQLKIANQRKDFQHKLSRKIADSCVVFLKEDLNIKGMMKNHRLSKEIVSVGWGGFFEKLKYKLERKGGAVISVGRFFASSQICSCCGAKNPDVKDLSVRKWTCPECGAIHDRDINAKQNIWREGVSLMESQDYIIYDNSITA